MSGSPVKPVPEGVRIAVRLTPRAARNGVQRLAETADGAGVLKVSVTAVPEQGRANEALIRLLARAWGVPKSSITLVAGAGDRNKTLMVAGDPAELKQRLDGWLAGLAED